MSGLSPRGVKWQGRYGIRQVILQFLDEHDERVCVCPFGGWLHYSLAGLRHFYTFMTHKSSPNHSPKKQPNGITVMELYLQ